MMGIADALVELHEKLESLEEGPAALGDWHRLEARAARVLIAAQQELARVQREVLAPPDAAGSSEPRSLSQRAQVQRLVEIMEELRIIRFCAEGRILELQAESMQRGFSNRVAP